MKKYSDVVCEVLILKGMDILLEERKFFSCLMDLSAVDFQKENRLTSHNFDQNMLKALYDAGNIGASQMDLAEKKVIYLLQEDTGMAENLAASLTGEIADGIRKYIGIKIAPAEQGSAVSSQDSMKTAKTPKSGTGLKQNKEVSKAPKTVVPAKSRTEKKPINNFDVVHEHSLVQGNGETLKCRFDYSTWTLTLDGCKSAVLHNVESNPGHKIPLTLVKNITVGDSIETLILNSKYLCMLKCNPSLDRITLGKGMKKLSLCHVTVSEFVVVNDHPEWYSEDGIVLSRDKKKLVAFPNARTGRYVMPDSVETVCDEAFYHSRINEVVLNKNLIFIGKRAFTGCSAFKELHLTGRIEEIGEYAFSECTGLEKMELAGKLTSSGQGTFSYCTDLKEIKLGNGIHTISESSFRGCMGLENFTIPDTVKLIQKNAFKDCDHLKILSIPNTPELEIHDAMPVCGYGTSSRKTNFSALYNAKKHTFDLIDFHGRTDFSKIDDTALREYAGKCIKCGGDYSIFGTCKRCKAKRPKATK